MDNLEKILEKANELGHLLKANEIVNRYRELAQKLEASEASQQLLQDYLEHTHGLLEKERAGKPIEPEEKKTLQELEDKVRADDILGDFLATQAYYMQMMDQVNLAIADPKGEPPKDSRIITPDDVPGIILPK